MKKAIGLIFVFWIGLVALPGCDSCNCPKQTYADIVGLRSFIWAKTSTTTVKVDEPVRWDVISYFALNYDIRSYTQRSQPTWGMVAYGCDCVPPGSLGSTETLTKLTVRTVFDFDTTHPVGSLLTDTAVLTNDSNVSRSVSDLLARGPVSYQDMQQFSRLSLGSAPTVKGPFALDITATLDNGEVYTARTPTIQIL